MCERGVMPKKGRSADGVLTYSLNTMHTLAGAPHSLVPPLGAARSSALNIRRESLFPPPWQSGSQPFSDGGGRATRKAPATGLIT